MSSSYEKRDEPTLGRLFFIEHLQFVSISPDRRYKGEMQVRKGLPL
jgi:hypothetical protein